MISVSMTADPAFQRLLDLTDAKVRTALAAGINEAAIVGQAAIVEDTPVITANLRDNIAVELATPDHLEAVIHTGTVPYAAYVEYGTGIYGEGPGARGTAFTVTNAFGRKGFTVTIQGMRPHAMFRKNIPVIRAHLDEAVRRHVYAVTRGQS